MRRSQLNDRTQRAYFGKAGSKSQAQQLNFSSLKFQPTKMQQNNFITSRNHLPHYHPKTAKHLLNRPYTTTKHPNHLQFKRDNHNTSHISRHHQPAKDLSLYSMREHHHHDKDHHNSTYYDSARFEHSKGRLYRGSSWKYDEKSFRDVQNGANRYQHHPSHHHQHANIHQKKDGPSFHDSHAEPTAKSRKAGGLVDILGQNMKKNDSKAEDDFFQYIMRFSYRTKKGYIPTNAGKVNQDNYIVNPNLNNHTWQHFFAVCDGHGPLGHQVSGFIKAALPQAISNSKGIDRHPKEALTRAFETAYERLLKQSKTDLNFSGSTVIACYFNQNRLLCANVGDSRAILGRYKSDSWSALALSDDHKPCVQKEAERIKKMKGRIEAFKDQYGESIGPLRVWVQGDNVPGLAMTRSFGDLVGASVGVSPIPEIKEFSLTEEDRIVVIGSDGVFQFLQNEAIIKSLVPFYEAKQIQQASDHLMSLAIKSWNKNSSIVDDITFILIFISYNEM